MGMGLIRLSVDKVTSFVDAIDAAFADLTPLSGQKGGRVQAMVPVGKAAGKVMEVEPGDWLVQARLPSGEVFTQRVSVEEGREEPVTLRASDSSRETRSWPTSLSYAAATFDATRETVHVSAIRRSFPRHKKTFALAEARLATEPYELLLWDPESRQFTSSGDWNAVGRAGEELAFDAEQFNLPPGVRAFIQLRDTPHILSLPLPWHGEKRTYVQVQAVPDLQGEEGEMTLRAFVLDPQLAPVIGFLDASDLAAARMLAPETASFAKRMLYGKFRNPLAGAAGALALLRLREYTLLHDWPLNLAAGVQWLPDGAAIAAWCTLKLGMAAEGKTLDAAGRAAEARSHVHTAAARGAPYFARSVSLLHHVCLLLQYAKTDARVDDEVAAWVASLHQSVKPDSFVASYEGSSIDETKLLLAGVRPPLPEAPPQRPAPGVAEPTKPRPVKSPATGLPGGQAERRRQSPTSKRAKVKKTAGKPKPQRRAAAKRSLAAIKKKIAAAKKRAAAAKKAAVAKAAKRKPAKRSSGRAGGARRERA
ncbi:MAG TPA: hypothetical protein VGR35_00360 [Tepidisphaeraceae bacterium]|nr:hypothetical protein [Tepidisphaeraceae bacterium]